ncbi:MAG: GNAT family N-acetyltransferase [Deltaproteobacteria bacterium]|nr:GNAT family N-acetyltransferase [Deltaproteobacteria bacterium]
MPNRSLVSLASGSIAPFDERLFYLEEFHGRTLAITALPGAMDGSSAAAVRGVVDTLLGNDTHVVLLLPSDAPSVLVSDAEVVAPTVTPFLPATWRAARGARPVWVPLDEQPFLPAVRRLVGQLHAFKLVVLDPRGGLAPASESTSSFVDLATLREHLRRGAGAREGLLREIESALADGETVNVCTADGLDAELFSYTGSGTLFTARRYVAVRRLGIDDLDAASSLIARGIEEGFLQPRSDADLDVVLTQAFGAFLDDRHLAGIGALRLYPAESAGELVSLYTLTRFQGEGIGRHLIKRIAEEATALSLSSLYACTTREPAARYFVREGFREIDAAELPAAKWAGYDEARKARLRCFRRALAPSIHH